jgi:hypothetical protein
LSRRREARSIARDFGDPEFVYPAAEGLKVRICAVLFGADDQEDIVGARTVAHLEQSRAIGIRNVAIRAVGLCVELAVHEQPQPSV